MIGHRIEPTPEDLEVLKRNLARMERWARAKYGLGWQRHVAKAAKNFVGDMTHFGPKDGEPMTPDDFSWMDDASLLIPSIHPARRRAYLKRRAWVRPVFLVLAVLAIVIGGLAGLSH